MRKILIPLIAVILASCVHEYPDATTPAPLELEFSFDLAMVMPEFIQNKSAATRSEPVDHLHDLRYQVKAYRMLNSGKYDDSPVASFSFIRDEVDEIAHVERVSLAEGRYRLLTWVDYINHGSGEDLYYNTSDFANIVFAGDKSGYVGSAHDKDVFIGESFIDLTRYGSEVDPVKATFELQRPVARFEIISKDLDKFKTKVLEAMLKGQGSSAGDTKAEVNIGDYYAVLSYTTYLPNLYDLTDSKDGVRSSGTGYSFRSSLTELSQTEVLLGFDYVMVKPDQPTSVGMSVSFHDKDGNVLASTENIDIPLLRGHVTRISGDYLTKTSHGGIGIDPGFENDYNIEIK